ncbi:hypothetical protein ASF48_04900 [Rathayibacter sp. Leaf299]|uniref:M23 family metallopeptidase n=1 Tax=Rathayibacter sp. Leaf299 TaxID=1736328 RepID=UPI0007004716|nr:M23 family metallopeptidase [Rathayibacter sp. Leaf299]KQQ22524.1 hypothetical protein ASF48_04900 [Rathayibacter sp. Leaf299]
MRIIKAARGRMTSPFGAKNVPGANVKSHGGVDWGHGNATEDDLRIVAPAAGKVTVAGWYGTYGNRIVIDHGRDENGDHWETLIAHLSEYIAEYGDQVEQAEEIGVMGNTGTKYVHCHQELRKNGRQVDPALYLTATSGGGANSTPATNNESEIPVQIPWNGGSQPAETVLANTLRGVQETLDIVRDFDGAPVTLEDGGEVTLATVLVAALRSSQMALNNTRVLAKQLGVTDGIE